MRYGRVLRAVEPGKKNGARGHYGDQWRKVGLGAMCLATKRLFEPKNGAQMKIPNGLAFCR